MGRCFLWWWFVWPVHRRRIRKRYVVDSRAAIAYLDRLMPNEAEGITRSIVVWLAWKHKWTLRPNPTT